MRNVPSVLSVLCVLAVLTGCGPAVKADPKVLVAAVAQSLTESEKTLRDIAAEGNTPVHQAVALARVADSLAANAKLLTDASKILAAATADMDKRIADLQKKIAGLEAEQSVYMMIVLAGCVGLGLLAFAGGGWGVWTGGGKPAWGIVLSGVLLAGGAFVLPQIGRPIGYGIIALVIALAAWCAFILARRALAATRSTAAGVDRMETVALNVARGLESLISAAPSLEFVRERLADEAGAAEAFAEVIKGDLKADQIAGGFRRLVARARGKAVK